MPKTLLAIGVVLVVSLALVGAALFLTGGKAPLEASHGSGVVQSAAQGETGGETDDAATHEAQAEDTAADESSASTGSVPPPDPRYPLARSIPGCICHSKDAKLVAQHRDYRMNQCFGCHKGGIPTGKK
jgi:hypothetical protein